MHFANFDILCIEIGKGLIFNSNLTGRVLEAAMTYIIGWIDTREVRERIKKEVRLEFSQLKEEFRVENGRAPDIGQEDDLRKIAWAGAMGGVTDFMSRAYNTSGYPQNIGVIGPHGANDMMLMSSQQLKTLQHYINGASNSEIMKVLIRDEQEE